jgi:hypothetical protein
MISACHSRAITLQREPQKRTSADGPDAADPHFAGALTVRLRSAKSLSSALAVVRDYRRGVLHANDWPGAA